MPRAVIVAAIAWLGCGTAAAPPDPGLERLALRTVEPRDVVPGSAIELAGDSFVPPGYGAARWRLIGGDLDIDLPARFVDYDTLAVDWPGDQVGDATGARSWIEVDSTVDGRRYVSPEIAVDFSAVDRLVPRLDEVATGVAIHVNEPLPVAGAGFLLGGDEGETVAIFSGCYQRDGADDCVDIEPQAVPLLPRDRHRRDAGTIAFDPAIADTIAPGRFRGELLLENRHGPLAGGAVTDTSGAPVEAAVLPPAIHGVATARASLGQLVAIEGGGFVGSDPGQITLLAIDATFTPDGDRPPRALAITLVPRFLAGPRVEQPLSEEDELGTAIDLRTESGVVAGTVTPVVRWNEEEVTGDPVAFRFEIAPVAQVVWIEFLPGYVEELRHFGLRAVDREIRARVLAVAARDFAGVNVVVRTEQPTDFALYSPVQISGIDPTGRGLFGLDNSAGRDVGNRRLHDKIGGAQAANQDDGTLGYGGVFVRSFFSFSAHPAGFAESSPLADPAFDALFDPFRPDVGGEPVVAADLAAPLAEIDPATDCPARARPQQIACAIWALGSMIGSTMTHEIGHSLGLANPDGTDANVHLPGERADRLMDGGAGRPFAERAEIDGAGPARFCQGEYLYLRQILPAADGGDDRPRPPCD